MCVVSDEFITLFWHALEDIYTYVDPYEQRTLIHKALLKKDDFLDRVKEALMDAVEDNKTCREVMDEFFAECREYLCD